MENLPPGEPAQRELDVKDPDASLSASSVPSVVEKPEVVDEIVDEKPAQEDDAPPQDPSTEEDDIVYPKGIKLATIVAALCLSVFIVALVSLSAALGGKAGGLTELRTTPS